MSRSLVVCVVLLLVVVVVLVLAAVVPAVCLRDSPEREIGEPPAL